MHVAETKTVRVGGRHASCGKCRHERVDLLRTAIAAAGFAGRRGARFRHDGAGGQSDEQASDGVVGSVDMLVIRLIVVGEQAAVAPPHAGRLRGVDKEIRISGCDRRINPVEMHHLEGATGDACKGVPFPAESRKDAGSAFGSLEGKDCTLAVPRRQRFGQNFTFLELELDL